MKCAIRTVVNDQNQMVLKSCLGTLSYWERSSSLCRPPPAPPLPLLPLYRFSHSFCSCRVSFEVSSLPSSPFLLRSNTKKNSGMPLGFKFWAPISSVDLNARLLGTIFTVYREIGHERTSSSNDRWWLGENVKGQIQKWQVILQPPLPANQKVAKTKEDAKVWMLILI